MNSSIDNQIREHLLSYLADESSLEEFHDWFAPVLWFIEQYGSKFAEHMAYRIELILAEFTQGHWTKSEFKRELLSLLAPPVTVVDVSVHADFRTGLSAQTVTLQLQLNGGTPPIIRTGMRSSTESVLVQ